MTWWPWSSPSEPTKPKRAKRKPAPIGVPTAPRLHLLAEIERGRVRYLTGSGQVRWRPSRGYGDPARQPVDVTQRVSELVRSRWASFEPPGSEDPPPHELFVLTTTEGMWLLVEARAKSRKRRKSSPK